MTPNVGSIDRAVRIAAGIVIIALGLVFTSWWGLLGLLPLVTGLVRWCPAYAPFGLATCRRGGGGSELPDRGGSR